LHHGELTSQWDAGVGAILSLDTYGARVACGGRNKTLAVWNGPEQTLGSHSGLDQVERVAIAANGKSLVATDAAGNIGLLDLQSVEEQQSLSLPIDDSELQVVFKRMEKAETDYASRHSQKTLAAQTRMSDSEPPAGANANTNAPSASTVLALKSEIDASRQKTAALRQNAAAISRSLSKTAETLKQLQQSQVELQAQLEKQDLLLAASEQQTAAIESAYANMLASNQQLSAEIAQQHKQSLKAKLDRQRKLLATSLQLLDLVNASSDTQDVDADLQKTRQLVLEFTQELRNRVQEVTTSLEAVDDNPATRASLADVEQ
jgi:chromosome segregation ATPase